MKKTSRTVKWRPEHVVLKDVLASMRRRLAHRSACRLQSPPDLLWSRLQHLVEDHDWIEHGYEALA